MLSACIKCWLRSWESQKALSDVDEDRPKPSENNENLWKSPSKFIPAQDKIQSNIGIN